MALGRWRILGVLAGAGLLLATGACMAPRSEAARPLEGWDTSYDGALSPSSQLALGLLEALRSEPGQLPRKEALAKRWSELAGLIERHAPAGEIASAVRGIEAQVDPQLLAKIRSRKYRRGDLIAFMTSSGAQLPRGGLGSVDPDREVAARLAAALEGRGPPAGAGYRVQEVPPEEALSPTEMLTLGTVTLLAAEPDSFEVQQIFRLALYFRPLRRLYDPKIEQTFDPRREAIYLDRIWRVLKPAQLARIRELGLTRKDLLAYLEKHRPMYQVDIKRDPGFALLEFAVNDFHAQIAPKEREVRGKYDYYIPGTVLASKDGKTLFEGVCAACHGVDGQGRFPPIGMKSYLSLHSDNEHFMIVKGGPPQGKGAPLLMPAFGDGPLTDEQIWAIVRYLRTFEKSGARPRGEDDARAAGVKLYDVERVHDLWTRKDPDVFLLDVQSDIAYRIMGHIPGSVHIAPDALNQKLENLRPGAKLPELPEGKEILVIDMFGSQGLPPAAALAKAGYRVSYLSTGMVEWHITRNYPVAYGN